MSFDPGANDNAVEKGTELLEKAADDLHDSVLAFEKAQEAWERVSLIAEAEIALDPDKKTSERTRRGLVLKAHATDPVYLEYVSAKADKAARIKRYDALKAALSARQSLLRARGS